MRAVLNRAGFIAALIVVAVLAPLAPTRVAAAPDASQKLDALLNARVARSGGSSRVIIGLSQNGASSTVASLLRIAGGLPGRRLNGGRSQVAIVPNAALRALARHPLVERISLDRPVGGSMERTATAIGAAIARQQFGYDGAGIGVAIIDSGIASWHDDLTDAGVGQRVARFVDFVDGFESAHDAYGHGTHVAGIIAGNGYDSDGARTGIAPAANLVVLRVLDGAGHGYISDVIAAIDYAIAQRSALNIRVMNLSVASGVYESFNTDPLTLAAKRAVDAGIVVVAAAGNNGRNQNGHAQYGGVTAPGNAPWVLTVGASSHMGTIDRGDDTIAAFTSRGPTAYDYAAKPDLVAPGIGIESLSNPDSSLYVSASPYLLSGTRPTSYLPYLSLSGTSMSAPVVAGTAALMLQANPSLTPNHVKAILQYTAQVYLNYDPLTEGAGFVNAKGAIELARHLGSPSTVPYPDASSWGARLIWGNRLVKGGRITSGANAWAVGVTWGAATTASGATVSWGMRCFGNDCTGGDTWRFGQGSTKNVVWGLQCDGADCTTVWTLDLVNATDGGETVVWGTDGGETVVWGTEDGETVVWGTDGGETVVWGTSCRDASCTPVIWGRR
jgi:serine protease AprX